MAVSNGKLSQGAIGTELEKRLAEAFGVPHVMMVTSGSTALVTAMVAAGIGPGDEVIVPNRTFIATANAAKLIGAQVRLVDVLADVPVMDPAQVESKITGKTKAIVPVHVNGSACDMKALREIADRHGLVIIEDTAQAMFSKTGDRYLGTFGDYGCFSLGVTKLMTSGQGGFVIVHDDEAFKRVQYMRFHGVSGPRQGRFDNFGFNFRYPDILASITMQQLDRIPAKIAAHVALYKRYQEALAGSNRIRLQPMNLENGEIPLWNQVMCEERTALVEFLKERGIGTEMTTPNLSESPHLHDDGPFPNATNFENHELILPSGPDQDPADIDRTLEALKEFLAS